MRSLVERVASRYLEAGSRQAAFIPDKFFTDYAARLKKLFSQELKGDALENAVRLISDEVVPLHERFIRDLIEATPTMAHQTLTDRLSLKKDQIQRLAQSLNEAKSAVAFPYPVRATRDHVMLHINTMVGTQLDKNFSTLGKMFKTQISIDPAKVQGIVDRALKKMTPEVRAAIDANDLDNRNSRLQYDFYQEHVDKSIPRLIQKKKVIIDWLSWFERIRDALAANYSEPLLHTADLYGMKVVVNDASVTPEQHKQYIKYLDEAYQRLKKKKLERAWYGNVFIECDGCGGVNQNTGKEDVAGHYFTGKDWVQIYNRPGEGIVHIMAHELGHRYWFRSMSQGQRARFEAYVRARAREKGPDRDRIPHVLESRVLDSAKKRIEDARLEVRGYIDRMERADVERSTPTIHFKRRLENAAGFILDMPSAAKVVRDLDAPKSAGPLFKRMIDSAEAASEYLMGFNDVLKQAQQQAADDATFTEAFALRLSRWCDDARELVDAAASQATGYAVHVFTEYNKVEEEKKREHDKKRQEAWDADEREILPVSEYGKSNIDEAFAEAFAWYVLDRKMTDAQREIFRSVLLRRDLTASSVARRWTQRLYGEGLLHHPTHGGGSPHH
jgi:hypothetical protein